MIGFFVRLTVDLIFGLVRLVVTLGWLLGQWIGIGLFWSARAGWKAWRQRQDQAHVAWAPPPPAPAPMTRSPEAAKLIDVSVTFTPRPMRRDRRP
jgi:hypothetical protein